jgi:hypothetical protein
MATLAQLYTRIILDTNRDDMAASGELEQAKIDAVAAAIDKHEAEEFWFNRASGSVSTVAATGTVTIPAAVRVVKKITYSGSELEKVDLESIQGRTETGQPTKWADDDGSIRLWPIPDAVYALSVFGTAALGVPGSSNEWTTYGYELILNEAKVILCRGPLRDPEGLSLAKDGREEALAALRRETRRRAGTVLKTELGSSGSYNINSDQ